MAFIDSTIWTAMQGYPKLSKDGTLTITEKYYTDWNNISLIDNVPSEGESYTGDFLTWEDAGDLEIDKIDVERSEAGDLAYLTLIYSREAKTGIDKPKDDEPQYDLEDGGLEKPIEEHPDYLMKWNHFIVGHEDTTSSTWWDEATDGSDTLGQADIQWVKSVENVPYVDGQGNQWVKLQDPIKPDVESYLVAAPIVNERIYHKDFEDAAAESLEVGKREVPGETFTLDEDATKWLIISANVQWNGKKWVVTKRYQYADNVDTDIYEATS